MNYSKMRNCPVCNANWVDKPIPKESREYYSPPYFFSRVIAMYDRDLDRTTHYICPDCKHEFPRN